MQILTRPKKKSGLKCGIVAVHFKNTNTIVDDRSERRT